MRNRARSENDEREEKSRTQSRMERHEQRTQTRVPKIQYRFIKELEEQGVSDETRNDAYAMAGKIRRFPLEDTHVMGSWERFTRTAIDAYKQGHGSDAERTRQHRAYAVLFSAIRDGQPIKDSLELKIRVDKFDVDQMKKADPRAPARTREKEAAAPPMQRTLALPEREEPRERDIDQRVDKMLVKLREIPFELRSTIEASARELLVDGHHTRQTAREALPRALDELKLEKSTQNTMYAFTLATVARTPTHDAQLLDLRCMKLEEHREIVRDARLRLEHYPPLETGVAAVRKDQIEATVRDVVNPSEKTRREALVLAQAREELESVADPKRRSWDHIAQELSIDF